MNYIGRKYSLLDFLDDGITSFVDRDATRFFDVFAGTGTVGRHFKQRGYRIVANDIQAFAYCLNRAFVGLNRPPAYSRLRGVLQVPKSARGIQPILDAVNGIRPKRGFIYRHYCPGGRAGRFYFSDDNGRKCDGIRGQIETWLRDGLLTESEHDYLRACLIVAMDRVANTASVYAAYLKHLKTTARRPVTLDAIPTTGGNGRHAVYNRNGADLVGRVACDILYMDPPYNQRQYCTNYHVLETIAAYDSPEVTGVTGLRPYEGQRSDFCVKGKALSALEDMIRRTRARYVFLSYNSEGLMARRDILDLMAGYGRVDLKRIRYPRFRADLDGENRTYRADAVTEYLFRLEKR